MNDLVQLSAAQARAMEPAVQCLAALHSPSTGIVDSHALMLSLQGDLENAGGMVAFNAPVARGECGSAGMVLHTADGTTLLADVVINAAGLMAPAMARRMDRRGR